MRACGMSTTASITFVMSQSTLQWKDVLMGIDIESRMVLYTVKLSVKCWNQVVLQTCENLCIHTTHNIAAPAASLIPLYC